jgi:sensor domain CHASE-containing protein
MVDFISKSLFLIAELGVIVVMVIIILKERRKRKESENKIKRNSLESSVPNQNTLYLD